MKWYLISLCIFQINCLVKIKNVRKTNIKKGIKLQPISSEFNLEKGEVQSVFRHGAERTCYMLEVSKNTEEFS